VPSDKRLKRRDSLDAFGSYDDKSGGRPSQNADVGVRPFAPPLSYLRQIGARRSEATRYPGMLACSFPTHNAASASSVSYALKRQHRDALPSVEQCGLK
jgi:hypothetical protein